MPRFSNLERSPKWSTLSNVSTSTQPYEFARQREEEEEGGKNFFLSASTDKSLKIVCDKLDALILKCVSEQVCSNVFSTEGLYFVNLNMS